MKYRVQLGTNLMQYQRIVSKSKTICQFVTTILSRRESNQRARIKALAAAFSKGSLHFKFIEIRRFGFVVSTCNDLNFGVSRQLLCAAGFQRATQGTNMLKPNVQSTTFQEMNSRRDRVRVRQRLNRRKGLFEFLKEQPHDVFEIGIANLIAQFADTRPIYHVSGFLGLTAIEEQLTDCLFHKLPSPTFNSLQSKKGHDETDPHVRRFSVCTSRQA
jgi:hypothetical protein